MKIAVVGAGVSGSSLAKLAKKLGNEVLVSDAQNISDEAKKNFDSLGINYEIGHKDLFNSELLVLSSGIPPHSPVIIEAKKRGVAVAGELDFVLPNLDGKIIGITGTNGKSTTTTLIGHILGEKYKVAVGGNLGYAMADFVGEKFDFLVLELSSAQLHYLTLENNKNCIAVVITNIAPDHIDWHGSYEKYIEAKGRVLSLVSDAGAVFLRAADISIFKPKNKNIITIEKKHGEIFRAKSPLVGEHNIENIACAVSVVRNVSNIFADDDEIARRLESYKGLPHRCEPVGTVAGVRYINDSKGTNVGAAITALESIDGGKIIILGGKGKGEDYAALAECVARRAKHAIVIGSEREKIASALINVGFNTATQVETLAEAVDIASKIAVPGDTVLLSPACTSWDQYKNFGERGDHFRALVEGLVKI